jgi:O-antigen/teichoic acid export membrane protein
VNKKTFLYASGLIVQNYGLILVGLLSSVFSARSLSVSDRGELAIFILITQLCSRLASIGFEQIVHRGEHNKGLQVFYLASTIGCILVLPIFYWGLRSTGLPLNFIIASVFVAMTVAALRVNIATLVYSEDLRTLTLLNFSQSIIQIFSYGIVFRYHNLHLFLTMWCITVIISTAFSFYLVRSRINYLSVNDIQDAFTSWKHGLKYSSTVVPEMATTFCIELPVIREVLGRQFAGTYAVSNTVTGVAYQVFVAVGSVMGKKRVRNILPVYIIMAVFCTIVAFISGNVIDFVFGDRYSLAEKYVKIAMPSIFILGILRLEQMSSDRAMRRSSQFISIFGLLALFSFAYLVNPKYLVLYISISYAVYAVFNIFSLRRERKNDLR